MNDQNPSWDQTPNQGSWGQPAPGHDGGGGGKPSGHSWNGPGSWWKTGSGDGSGGDPNGGMSNKNKNAFVFMQGILSQYGLQSLAKVVLGFIKQGYQADAINVLIQQTPEWKQRFAGNELRTKNGLPPLDPSTYLSTEAAYSQAIRAAGLPTGFYDGGDNFAKWIGGDVSASEVQQRASDAATLADSTDSETLQALHQYYGIDKGHIAAYFLDQKTALPILQQQAAAASVGGAAIRQGLSLSEDRANHFAQMGVSGQQANAAYSQIGAALPAEQNLAAIYHQQYGQKDLENELLGGDGAATTARQTLNQKEKAQFSGSGAVGSTIYQPGYGVGQPTSGQF